jgi:hypothetical protein
MSMLNTQLGDATLAPKTFDSVFEKWWPELDSQIKKELERAPAEVDRKQRSQRELLEEVLTLVRGLVRDLVPDETARALVASYEKVVQAAVQENKQGLLEALSAMATPLGLLPKRRSQSILSMWLGGHDLTLMRALSLLKAQEKSIPTTDTEPPT